MPCYHPLSAYQRVDGQVVFVERGDIARSLTLPCGQCIGCRLERSRQWAVRCMHESQLHAQSCFVTLTYDDLFLPPGASLHYPHFQGFMKRLRRFFSPVRLRFYMAGEYGELLSRPHYHALVFGVDFSDKLYWRTSPGGAKLYTSADLASLWQFGFSSVGSVTFESAAYVARYCMKKITGNSAEEHYRSVDFDSGEVVSRVPEFNRMSLKPGIGAGWLSKFQSDVYPHGQVVVNGVECKPPRYYDKLFELVDGFAFDAMVQSRGLEADLRSVDNTPERLSVREHVARARISQLKRSI